MLGLKRGTVELLPHQPEWDAQACAAIALLKRLLGDAAVDIQHVGSTAIPAIHAKPIVDIAVGVRALEDTLSHIESLERAGVLYRGEDHPSQQLFVMGNDERDIRTHHIHVVPWKGLAWNHYIAFRDYLNAFPEKAREYDALKRSLAARFADDRPRYTAGKQALIDRLLLEAETWKG